MDFPAASGSQVYIGTTISLFGADAFNNSWPGMSALVSSGSSPVTLTLFAYDDVLDTEVEFFSSTIAANLSNQPMGAGTSENQISLTRFVFTSQAEFAIDDLQLGFADVASQIPEPASWLMFVSGFGAAGGALRMRQRQTA